ncbi:MAG TPA: hypothetical protein VGE44_00115 [Daejeonella sp.]|uniref:hypothetical protein n=1 Tax=Daejeonella sp. TaxID=2805397 RepID=UPI002ED99AA1
MKNLNLRYFRDLVLCAAFILSVKSLLAEPARYSSFSYAVNRNQETVVYITNTGTKYHKSSCRYLNQSKIKTTLKKAVAAGNVACKVCKI